MGIMEFLELKKSRKCFLLAEFGPVEFLSKERNNPNSATGRDERIKQRRGREGLTVEQR